MHGKWIRINDQTPDNITYESWKKDGTGIGYTLNKKDTVFMELLTIENINDTLFLKVTGVNESPTLFKFTTLTDSLFICENDRNEFPKKIKYWKHQNYLNAEVSDNTIKINFKFKRLK